MAAEIDDNEPVPKLTAKLRSEIMPPEPFEYTVLKPAEPIAETENKEESTAGLEPAQTPINSEDEEETFEETVESVDIPKIQERKPQPQKARKSKVTRKSPARVESENKPISKLHDELRKHTEARKKAEREILDIRKELKDLLLIHHATIKDLQKQVAQMHRKIASIDSSRKSTKSKTIGKKAASSKKSKKKSVKKKSRNRG
jgi:hypothetical protein